jgi:UDPglucose 6-dehydrogenase
LVLITAWGEYKALDLNRVRQAMAGRLVVDTANLLDPDAVRGAGFQYLDIGRGRSVS